MRSDIYALGAILFELLSGRPPFTGVNPLDIAEQHVKQVIPSLRALRPDIPVALESVINQALAREPARRFQSATELFEAFVQVSQGATGHFRLPVKREGLFHADGTKAPAMAHSPEPPKGNIGGKGSKWQLLPPIVLGDLPNVELPKSLPVKLPVLQPDIPQEDMPQLKSASPPTQISLSEDASADSLEPFAWWSQPSQEPSPYKGNDSSLDWGEAQLAEPSLLPTKRPRSSGKRSGNLNRRQVVALLGTGAAVVAGALVAVNVNLGRMMDNATNPHSPQATNTGNQIQGQVTPTGSPQNQPAGGHKGIVIGSTQMAINTSVEFINPTDHNLSLLVHLPDGNFVAYEKACTHEGVNVHYDSATHTLVCPAHGAVFDPANRGSILQGPATKPLTNVMIRVNGDGTMTTG